MLQFRDLQKGLLALLRWGKVDDGFFFFFFLKKHLLATFISLSILFISTMLFLKNRKVTKKEKPSYKVRVELRMRLYKCQEGS